MLLPASRTVAFFMAIVVTPMIYYFFAIHSMNSEDLACITSKQPSWTVAALRLIDGVTIKTGSN